MLQILQSHGGGLAQQFTFEFRGENNMADNLNQAKYEQNNEEKKLPTIGELERLLGQSIGSLYRQLTGQQPQRIICHVFANTVGILIEQSTTPVEKLLFNAAQFDLANQVRLCINDAIRQQIKAVAGSEMTVAVEAVLIDSVLGTGHTGIFLMLVDTPNVRNPSAIPKTDANRKSKRKQNGDRNGELTFLSTQA